MSSRKLWLFDVVDGSSLVSSVPEVDAAEDRNGDNEYDGDDDELDRSAD